MQDHIPRTLIALCVGLAAACSDQTVSDSTSNADATSTDSSSADTDPAESGTDGETSAETSTQTDTDTETGPLDETDTETDTGTDDGPPPDMGVPPDPNEQIPPPDEEGCHAIYAQDLLPTFELVIHPVVWAQLETEWLEGQMNEDLGVNPKPYHPLQEFRYGDIVIKDAEIRLRGNPTYWYPDDKLQFQIGFHTNDPDGRFLGIKRLALDAATFNRHLLRDRLAYAVMRDVGIKAPCANNARVNINGEYYGIFTSVEKVDEVFLERNFDDPTGDLWKRANWVLKTNEDTSNDDRVDAMRDAETLEELFTYLDIEQALRVFAAEAVLPDSDGMWAGGLNFYMYDEPIGGKFMLLPWDMDNVFERFNDEPDGEYPVNPDPFVWEKPTTHGRPWYDIPVADPTWFALYIDLIDEIVHDGYTPEKMHERIDTWSAQIHDAVFEDVNKPYSNNLYTNKVAELHEYVDGRYIFVHEWLLCWQGGGVDNGQGYCELP
ncbi:Inner spore coat protein H [Enhygromyxa salina]|uniref:Inner spore coat protein H n=1 Tax=Enhygromyxa salina TaxID=215803 RepID=A0A2S9XNN1_9BACT|nr:Inner spore coat protein H [Enhygromyxa salina]